MAPIASPRELAVDQRALVPLDEEAGGLENSEAESTCRASGTARRGAGKQWHVHPRVERRELPVRRLSRQCVQPLADPSGHVRRIAPLAHRILSGAVSRHREGMRGASHDQKLDVGTMRSEALAMRHLRGGDVRFITAPFTGFGTSADGQPQNEPDPCRAAALEAAKDVVLGVSGAAFTLRAARLVARGGRAFRAAGRGLGDGATTARAAGRGWWASGREAAQTAAGIELFGLGASAFVGAVNGVSTYDVIKEGIGLTGPVGGIIVAGMSVLEAATCYVNK